MQRVHFPTPFAHAHPPVRDVNQIDSERLTAGQRAADRVAAQNEALARIVEALAANTNRAGEE